MKTDNKTFDTIEDFLFNKELILLVNNNDRLGIERFIALYPTKEKVVRDVIFLLQYLHVEMNEIPSSQIENDWNHLLLKVKINKIKKRKREIYLFMSTFAACVAVIILAWFINKSEYPFSDQKEQLFSLINSTEIKGGEIEIVSGDARVEIGNDKIIEQMQEGNIMVDKEEKIQSSNMDEYQTIIVPKGKRTIMKFHDGTTAWINSGTKVVYPKNFGEKSRDILVDGEIYLEVAANLQKPFYVHTEKFYLQVLGTKFNVEAYSQDSMASVVLVEGSVEVSINKDKSKLLPSQGFFSCEGTTQIKEVDTYPYTCWKDGVMKLNGEFLSVIFKRLSRYYGVEIDLENKFINEEYVGKLNLKDSIEEVLYSLSLTTNFTYSRIDNTIYIN